MKIGFFSCISWDFKGNAMTAITLINKLTPTGLTIKEAIIIAERAEAIEAAAMKIRREAVGAKIYTYKEL